MNVKERLGFEKRMESWLCVIRDGPSEWVGVWVGEVPIEDGKRNL